MLVLYPTTEESDTSINSSLLLVSDDNLSFSGDLDSFVVPIDASSSSFTSFCQDDENEDPYLEPLSALRNRLQTVKKTSSRCAKESGLVAALPTPNIVRANEASIQVHPVTFIAIPKRHHLPLLSWDDENREMDNDSQGLDESSIVNARPVTTGSLVVDPSITNEALEERIRIIQTTIQKEENKVLRPIPIIDPECSHHQSPPSTFEHPKSASTASLYMELGSLELHRKSYSAAIQAFFRAATRYRSQDTLSLANALDCAVIAFCRALQEERSTDWMHHPQFKPSRFYAAIDEAVQIRQQELGTKHVETMEAIHLAAQLCVCTGEPSQAISHYLEMIRIHTTLFGPHHADMTEVAQDLGNAYLQCQDIASAQKWYQYAAHIYSTTKPPARSFQTLWRDTKRLERIHRWTQEDPAEDENLLFEL